MKKIIALLLLSLFLACTNSSSTSPILPFAFEGKWYGTYTGSGGPSGTGDAGSWQILVNAQGVATGSATSTTFVNTVAIITGNVTMSGGLAATFGSTTTNSTFNGQFQNLSCNGTWTNKSVTPNYNGTWTGTKQ